MCQDNIARVRGVKLCIDVLLKHIGVIYVHDVIYWYLPIYPDPCFHQ